MDQRWDCTVYTLPKEWSLRLLVRHVPRERQLVGVQLQILLMEMEYGLVEVVGAGGITADGRDGMSSSMYVEYA